MLRDHGVDLVCLAGYMRLLSPVFIRAFPGRILNVHPRCCRRSRAWRPQRQALEHGVKVSGATVHLVDEGLDSGPIVLQEAVRVSRTTTRRRRSRRASWRRSIGSIRAPCGVVLERPVARRGPPRRCWRVREPAHRESLDLAHEGLRGRGHGRAPPGEAGPAASRSPSRSASIPPRPTSTWATPCSCGR